MNSEQQLQDKIQSFKRIEEALLYFEIDFDSSFIEQYRQALTKRFYGNLLIAKPSDWFAARRALKNAYCKVQRSRLDPTTRSACRGCTSCERR
ncbi:hypothetical protein [Agarivorans gilvus]|uniref:Nitrogenase-stabilizing/protective protein NifW n=1 Tax=Agarivorans gilvus TaxID=680279 RepID=A0ABQ1I037_9ALTE|nr:hypothetical protein [Agarivorans gilvus]GGB02031.1 hypothetical protein GCM10007414_14080 [Agarivorans gilvus]